MKRGVVWTLLFSLVGIGGLYSAQAATFNSSSFSINGNLGDSIAGSQSSTSYNLTSAGGESIAGGAASKSYKLGQGYMPTLENSLQVVTQPSGLSAYWPMDDTSGGGPMLDESQNGNNGSYEASSVKTTGKVGDAWSDFNTNQYATVPSSASLPSGNKLTVSAWVKPSNLGVQRAIAGKWDYDLTYTANRGQWMLQTASPSDRLRVFIPTGLGDDGNNYVDSTSTDLTVGTWSHVAFVYDGSLANAQRVKIYVNGVEKSTTTTGTIPTSLYAASPDPVTIGNFPGLNRYWAGAIDEVKVFDRALTIDDLKAEYVAGNAGIPAGLHFGNVNPGSSRTAMLDSIVQTSAGGYGLAINQNHNLQTGLSGASADFAQNFDSFSDGSVLTTGNTGFSSITSSGGGTPVVSSASPIHNGFARLETTSSSTFSVQHSYASTSSRYYRFYVRMSSIPSSTQSIMTLRDNTSSTVSAIRIQNDGTFMLRNGNIAVATSSSALSANQWARIELFYDATNSTQSLRLFMGSNYDGSVPDETLTGAATNGATVDANYGIVTSQASQVLDLDEMATATTGWLGASGGTAIPSIGSSIGSPAAWSEGTTKGLGFTLYSTNATAIPGAWGSGSNYAAIPNSGTTFYSRSGYTGGAKDVLGLRLRLDVASNQELGEYSNQMTITGTMTP